MTMRRLLPVLALAVCAAPAHAQTAKPDPLERLSWLAGCWSGETGGRVVEERWLPLRAGTLVGASRVSRGARTLSVELSVVRLRGDTLVFEAHPVGQAPAVFAAQAQSDSSVVFSNPAHDFPQRILYRRAGADSLYARVEGPGEGGAVQGLDFRYRREPACAGRLP